MKKMTENIAGTRVCSMHIEFNLRHKSTGNSVVFECSSVVFRRRIKTVVCLRIDRCVFDDNENAYS